LSYQLFASDHYSIARWWVNSSDFAINNGLLQNITQLNYGVYYLEVRAYDPSDNYVSHSLSISVVDTILPTVDSPEDVFFQEGEAGYAISWNIFDYNPSTYEILKDGVSIESGIWTSEINQVQYSLDGLSSGSYLFSIVLSDAAGNTVSDDVQVTVESPSPTTTTTSKEPPSSITTTPTETGTPTSANGELAGLDMLALGLVGIGVGVAVVIVLFILKRK
jgi:hypothetical protein